MKIRFALIGLALVVVSCAYYEQANRPQDFLAIQPAPVIGVLPDPGLTPGAINTSITQANIRLTICNPSWSTKTVRPPSSYTTALKRQQLAAGYAVGGDTAVADYEEDHLISLELGGNPTDPKNLWPESYKTTPNARDKDKVENLLHREVCAGTITLQQAQQGIAQNWTQYLARAGAQAPITDQGDD